jgi:hypothetical protein
MAPKLATYPVRPDRPLILVLGRSDGRVDVVRGIPRAAELGGEHVLLLRLSDVDDVNLDRPDL